MAPQPTYSCETSLDAGEPLWAHATRVDRWILLGYEGPYEGKALPFSDLPDEVKGKLIGLQKEGGNVRVQFIRRPGESYRDRVPLYLARSDSSDPWLWPLELKDHREVLDLDFEDMFAEGPEEGGGADPLFMICVNGRRDLCCARNGQPVYEAMAAIAPEQTYQTTHLGGHRFAATGIVLPESLHYGRLQPAEAPTLLDATKAGRILLDRYRGRTTLSTAAQAAAHQLRQEFDLEGIKDLRLAAEDRVAEEEWLVKFEIAGHPEPVSRRVVPSTEVYRVVKTTGDEEAADVRHFQVDPVD